MRFFNRSGRRNSDFKILSMTQETVRSARIFGRFELKVLAFKEYVDTWK